MDVISYALSKKYTDKKIDEQKLKVAKVESELNSFKTTISQINVNQEVTQKVSGYSILSLPPNAANGQISGVELKGLTATNLIKNGDFRNGTENWWVAGNAGTLSAINNTLILTGNGTNKAPNIYQTLELTPEVNKKIFVRAKIRVTNSECKVINIYLGDNTVGAINAIKEILYPTEDIWYTLYDIVNISQDYSGKLRIYIFNNYEDAETTNGKVMEVQEVFALDLTALGLEDKTADEINEMFPYYFSSTKSTICAGRFRAVGKNLFNGELEIGNISINTGQNNSDSTSIRSKGYIRVQPNTTYRTWRKDGATTTFGYRFYDENKNYLGRISGIGPITTPSNCAYMRFIIINETNTNIEIQIEKGNTATEYEPYRESNAYVIAKDPTTGEILEARSLPNGTKDEFNIVEGKYTKKVSDTVSVSGTMFASLDTTTYVNVDAVKTTAFSDAMAGTTGKDGMTRLYDKNGVELTEVAQTDIDNTASIGKYYWHTDKTLWIIVAKGAYADITAARTALGTMTLNYQLAEPIVTPVEVSGNLITYPSGTIYVEKAVPDAGIYSNGITVLHADLPIKEIEKVSKIDFATGLETELDPSDCIISDDKLSFTHPELQDGDIVFFTYFYDVESTEGELEVEYYDSRYVIKDSVTGKFYKWNIAVANGIPTIEVQEV